MYLGLGNRLTRGQSEMPALTLELMRSSLDSRLVFSRASAGTDIINGVVTNFPVDVPRVSAANGLLIEPQTTNMCLNSSNIGGTTWNSFGCTVTQNAAIAPDGTLTATRILTTGTRGGCYAALVTSSSGTTYTSSAFFKWESGSTTLRLVVGGGGDFGSGSDRYVDFNGQTGAFVGKSSEVFAYSIQTLANGWFRVSGTFTATSSGSPSPVTTYGESSGISFLAWGATREVGYAPSSYIKTTTASATRAADICTGPIDWLNEAEGTLYVNAVPLSLDPTLATSPRAVCLHDGAGTSYHEIRRLASDASAQGAVTKSGLNQATLGAISWTAGVAAKAALAWKNNDVSFCFAGGGVATDTSTPEGMPAGITTLRLGANGPANGFWNGYLRSVRCWRRRLPDDLLRGII